MLKRLKRYGVLKNVQLFWLTLYSHCIGNRSAKDSFQDVLLSPLCVCDLNSTENLCMS